MSSLLTVLCRTRAAVDLDVDDGPSGTIVLTHVVG